MSSDVMLVQKAPPPDKSDELRIITNISNSADREKTCALYDTGADDMITNDPFIIHGLQLLLKDDRKKTTFFTIWWRINAAHEIREDKNNQDETHYDNEYHSC